MCHGKRPVFRLLFEDKRWKTYRGMHPEGVFKYAKAIKTL